MISIVRLGTPRVPGEGPRLGTVRRPPRGVRKTEISRRNYYDAWLPELAPSAPLVSAAQHAVTLAAWRKFVRSYRSEMSKPPAARLLDVLALLSHSTSLSVGCYCEDESRCHRAVLRQLLLERGAAITPEP